MKMDIYKICGWIALLIAIVGAFARIPYAMPVIAILGAVVGFSIMAEHHVRVIVSALALHTVSGAFDGIPAIGGYITAILSNIGVIAAGAALLIIMRNMIARMRA